MLLLLLAALPARAAPRVVAAEGVYGGVAAAVAGPYATVTSVLTSPAQDPHEFEPPLSAARGIARAAIVIVNGGGYDGWMDRLLAASPDPGRRVVNVAALCRARPGDNPHFWINPETMPAVARFLAAALIEADPQHIAAYQANLRQALTALDGVRQRAAALRAQYRGAPVAATEAVTAPLAAALGLDLREPGFGIAIMNGTEPRASDVAGMEADLAGHRVRALIVNAQVTSAVTRRLEALARAARVPVVTVTELPPPGVSYPDWISGEMNALAAALAAGMPKAELQ